MPEFDPVGLFGLVYWYSLYPLHQLVFGGMLRNIAKAAQLGGPDPRRDKKHDAVSNVTAAT